MSVENESKKKSNRSTAEIVTEMALPVAERLGLKLWDVQYLKEGSEWFLRIFIDKEGGVGIDDCVDMTHELNPLLDAADPIKNEYSLEVSSPGICRRLSKPSHLKSFIESPVKVLLIRPIEGKGREIEGILVDADESGGFEVLVEEDLSISFNLKECSRVNLMDDDF